MKTIFLASDFSKASDHAALYGMELARGLKCTCNSLSRIRSSDSLDGGIQYNSR